MPPALQSPSSEATAPPVFIVGAPRSGTSLLYRLLQFHDSFALRNCTTSTGVELTETRAFSDPNRLLGENTSHVRQFLLNDSTQIDAFLHAASPLRMHRHLIRSAQVLQKLLSRVNAPPPIRRWLWQATQNPTLIRTFFAHAQAARGCQRLLEKTPQHIFYLPEINATYPDCKQIFIHRHPLDVFASYKRRLRDAREAGKDPSALRWLELGTNRFCDRYRRYMTSAFAEQAKSPERFLLVAYDALVQEPAVQLSRVCDFLDEPHQSSILEDAQRRTVHFAEDPKLFRPVERSRPVWPDLLTEQNVRTIQSNLSDIMARSGYPRHVHPRSAH